MEIFVPILKVDAARREVYGVMAEEAVDKSGEIFDYASSKPYVKAWVEEFQNATGGKSCGNVRAQHSQIAAGKLVGVTFDDENKRIPVVAKIVDDNEWKKIEEGVYTGFSIGGGYVKRWNEGATVRYTAKPAEVSIVDNPCMYGAKFTMVKASGATEFRPFAGTAAGTPRQQPGPRFVPGGVNKTDVAEVELAKARRNQWGIDRPRPFSN